MPIGTKRTRVWQRKPKVIRPATLRSRPGSLRSAIDYAGMGMAYLASRSKGSSPRQQVLEAIGRKKIATRRQFSKIVEGHGDITYSKFTRYRKPRNKLEKRLAAVRGKITRRYVDTWKLTGVTGRQRADYFAYFERDHLKKMVADVFDSITGTEMTRTGGYTTNVTMNDLVPYMSNSNHCLTISNMENASTQVTVYDLLAKKDTDEPPTISWSKGLTLQNEPQDPNLWVFPVGSNPLQSKQFRDTWKVEKTTRLVLKPGHNHKHYLHVNPNMTVSNQRLSQSSPPPPYFLGGVSRTILVVTEGVLVTSYADASKVSTAPVAIGVMWQRTYGYTANSQAHRLNYAAETILPSFTDGRVIQEDGDIANVANV